MYRILVVEDERPISDLIEMNLSEAGYTCVCAYDGLEAANLLEKEGYDLVLLDIMLPKVSGYELLDFIKPLGIPVIFLTAKGTMADKVKGLRLGADDYLVKPFEIVELLARVEAVLRRAGKSATEISIEGLTIDTRSHTVMRGSRQIPLTAKEFELLLLFVRRSMVISRWCSKTTGSMLVIRALTKSLRQCLPATAQAATMFRWWLRRMIPSALPEMR